VFAFVAVFVVSRMRACVRHAVFGRGVATPSLNILRAFFGISFFQMPEENSARMVLIFFLYFCLVIRTAYQGVFFEIMTTDPRKASPKTIDDLCDMNFTVHCMPLADGSPNKWFKATCG
jgi:hypothetical protein